MKHNKIRINKCFVVIISIFTLSCSKPITQVFETTSSNVNLQQNNYFFENDTVKITYNLWASRGVLSFEIHNKTDNPIFIDWQKSSFIYNNRKINYWIDEEITKSIQFQNGSTYNNPTNISTTYYKDITTTTSKTTKPEKITFIPPKSNYYRNQFYLINQRSYKMPINAEISSVPRHDNNKKTTTIYISKYTADTSPIKFRNFLAFTLNETSNQYFFIDNDFYISSIKEMDTKEFNGAPLSVDEFGNYMYNTQYKNSSSFYLQIPYEDCLEFFINQNK